MASCVGVDVGGTFTDLIFFDAEAGSYEVRKTLTTKAAPEQGVITALSGLTRAQVERASFFVHGTTVALNALLERKSRGVSLLTTRGFRDILEIRRGDREEPYNLFWKPSDPLVPRRLRIPITERMRADGQVDLPIVREDVELAAEILTQHDVASVAIAFLHSYANPSHELEAEEILRGAGFSGEISLSHLVSGQFREYERTSTTVIDAYVRPYVGDYLGRLDAALAEEGFEGASLITRSGGGAMTFAEADERAVETIMSGPVAGAQGAAVLAKALNLGSAITADVGGTSFDTCLIRDGVPELMYEGSVAGLPVQTPWVDIRSIGAGGGSIARVDVGGLLQVGPQSAGADPGPACYGRDGREPTVTDAAFVLGMLADGRLAGGVTLNRALADAALAPLQEALSLSQDKVARGVITIATVAMSNAIREITIERGEDPRDSALVAFGGAGPLFGTLLARELGIGLVLVPPHAGNFSAWGLLNSDISQTAARTQVMPLTDESLARAALTLEQLFAEIDARTAQRTTAGATREASLDLRYLGQEHTLSIGSGVTDAGINATAAEVARQFGQEYERVFGHSMDEQVEIVHVRATTRTPLFSSDRDVAAENAGRPAHSEPVTAFSFRAGRRIPFQVVRRESIDAASGLNGPVIVMEPTATTYVDIGFRVESGPMGVLLLHDEEDTNGDR